MSKESTIQIRVTAAEKKAIEAAAQRNGMSVSVWLRFVALSVNKRK